MSPQVESNWHDTVERFEAVVQSMRLSLDLMKPLPEFRLALIRSGSVTAQVRMTAPSHVAVEFGERFQKRLLASIDKIEDLQLHSLLAFADPYSAYIVMPDQARVALYTIAEQFVVCHELFHVIGGHLDHRVATSSGRSFSLGEVGRATAARTTRKDGERLTVASELSLHLELEADASALQFLADHCVIEDLTNALNIKLDSTTSYSGNDRILAFRLVLAGVWLVLLTLEGNRGKGHRSLEHPWPGARLIALLCVLMPYFIGKASTREDEIGQQFITLQGDTYAQAQQYMEQVAVPVVRFVLTQAQPVQTYSLNGLLDQGQTDLLVDILFDLKGLLYDEKLRTTAGRQLLFLYQRRRHFFELLRPFRYLAGLADE